jgi:hypothetical protein
MNRSKALENELKAADVEEVGSPLFNFADPPALKAVSIISPSLGRHSATRASNCRAKCGLPPAVWALIDHLASHFPRDALT